MKRMFIALLCAACGAPVGSEPPELKFIYSHTVNGDGAGCAVIYTTDPRVLLRCEPGGELVRACPFDAGDQFDSFDVYALPGAGDGTPFGTASFVEFDPSAC